MEMACNANHLVIKELQLKINSETVGSLRYFSYLYVYNDVAEDIRSPNRVRTVPNNKSGLIIREYGNRRVEVPLIVFLKKR